MFHGFVHNTTALVATKNSKLSAYFSFRGSHFPVLIINGAFHFLSVSAESAGVLSSKHGSSECYFKVMVFPLSMQKHSSHLKGNKR